MPDVPWAAIAGLRNIVVHEYFRVNPDLILDLLDHQLAPLAERLRDIYMGRVKTPQASESPRT